MGNAGPLIVSVIAGVIGLAMVAVLVSKNAQTSTVISGAGSALSSVISSAVSPITGSSTSSTNQFGSSGSTG
jgi:hypothetical protein